MIQGIVQSSYERSYTVPNGKNFYLTTLNIPFYVTQAGDNGRVLINGEEIFVSSSNEYSSTYGLIFQNLSYFLKIYF